MPDNWNGKLRTDKLFVLTEESINLVNSNLASIKFPTNIIKRMPNITSKLKSIELENLLYYGVVAFEGIFPHKEFELFKILSFIIASLSSRFINSQQIETVDMLIKTFIQKYADLYPIVMHKYNIHMLMHLPGVAKKFVLLITNSAYQVDNSMNNEYEYE